MNQKKLFIAVGLTFVLAMIILLAKQGAINAQDCRLIRIQGMETHESIRVEPESLWISKGTCVIWVNRAAAPEVKIVFEDGKKCSSVSEAPTGFSLDHENCYVTSWLPLGGTSSLRFKEEGTFEYAIDVTGGDIGEKGKRVAKGRIVVR